MHNSCSTPLPPTCQAQRIGAKDEGDEVNQAASHGLQSGLLAQQGVQCDQVEAAASGHVLRV